VLNVRYAQTTLENLLRETIELAFKRRLPTVASIAALRAVATQGASGSQRTADDIITVVTTTPTTSAYRWIPTSAHADDGAAWVKPADVQAGQVGRWSLWTSPIRYVPVVDGPDYTLDQLPFQDSKNQPLQQVILLDESMSPEDIAALVLGQVPACVIVPDDDDPEATDLNSGWRWRDTFNFTISVICENRRNRREAAMGSDVDADPYPGANEIDGMIWELLAGAGAGRLNEVVDAIVDVQPSTGTNWSSELGQRRVFRSRKYRVIATLSNPAGSNDAGPLQKILAQQQFAQTSSALVADTANLVTAGCDVPLGVGLTKPVHAGTALIDSAAITYAGELATFPTSSDTYRDLNEDGTMTFTSVAIDGAPPDLASGAMRVGCTRTDGSGVLSDVFLCAVKTNYGNPLETDLT
jgi:hypothetical protein